MAPLPSKPLKPAILPSAPVAPPTSASANPIAVRPLPISGQDKEPNFLRLLAISSRD